MGNPRRVARMTTGGGGGHDGDKYFSDEAFTQTDDSWWGRNANHKSTSILVHMSPDEFLSLATRLPSVGGIPSKAEAIAGLLESGTKFDSLPLLAFTHDGYGTAEAAPGYHEGRHRAMALKGLGVKSMPVALKSVRQKDGDGPVIRWGSQRKGDFDRIDGEWPKLLKGDGRPTRIPFPVPDLRDAA